MIPSVVDYFLSLVRIESESGDERKVALKLIEDLKELKAEIFMDEVHLQTGGNCGNLYAFFPGNIPVEPILFCAHLDTVKPGKGIKPQIIDNRIMSDGTTILGADDKSGIAEIICAVKEMIASGEKMPPVEVLFTVSEEVGLLGAKGVDYSRLKSKIGYALDGHNIGEMLISAPAQNSMKFTVHGKEAHAGVEPEKGINAIKAAAAAIVKMPSGRIDFETTANIGLINGGKATNIVPPSVKIEAEVRSHNMQKLEKVTSEYITALEQCVSDYSTDSIKVKVVQDIKRVYQSFHIPAESTPVKLGLAASEKLGITSKILSGGGGSDANIFNQNGMQVIIAGSGMQAVHTTDEYIEIAQLELGVSWLKEIIRLYGTSGN
ncbi:MAG: M20/M25/M40 family metallo-hydrolase [Candidatus Cloacimonetes bacterium]|nr:M20/M25/M40 family metallo-hydrolase [Candidatus Cloacimonadota bacterium]